MAGTGRPGGCVRDPASWGHGPASSHRLRSAPSRDRLASQGSQTSCVGSFMDRGVREDVSARTAGRPRGQAPSVRRCVRALGSHPDARRRADPKTQSTLTLTETATLTRAVAAAYPPPPALHTAEPCPRCGGLHGLRVPASCERAALAVIPKEPSCACVCSLRAAAARLGRTARLVGDLGGTVRGETRTQTARSSPSPG